MRKSILILMLLFMTLSCSRYGAENLKSFIEYRTESEKYVRWTKEQQITWDMFKGDIDGQGTCNIFFGLYFFYNIQDGLKFNATIYFDKDKSWVKPKEQWGKSAEYYDHGQKLLKLQFDYYEATMRQLRKFLIEHKDVLTDEGQVRDLGNEYYNKAEAEWTEIINKLDYDFSDNKLDAIRQMIDSKLDELKEFDTHVNSTF